MYGSDASRGNSADLCAEIERVAGLIWDEGFRSIAAQMDLRIASGSTGTEILMGVSHTLNQFVATRPKLSKSVEREVTALVQTIGNALR